MTTVSQQIESEQADRLGPVLSFMQALWALEHGLNARSKAMNRELGVTGPQRLVLRVISQLGPMPPGQLAAILHLHPASVTRLAKTLEARKLLRRQPDPQDGRKLVLELGRAARPLLLPSPSTIEGAVREALAGASKKEIAVALGLVGRIAEALHRK
jgi:DNA-binding MarR family transcriptional regulator